MSADANALFQPFTLGDLTLPNRLVMAPLTRNRAAEGDVARDITATYYAQRASAGLLISEGSQISHQGQGYLRTPGIYTPEQVAALAQGDRRGPQGRRPHLHPALACGPRVPYLAAAGRRRACRPLAASRADQDLPRRGLCRGVGAPRARTLRDPRHPARLRACGPQRQGGRLRRRRDPCGQRLSARPVHEGRLEPAQRRLWRLHREPGPPDHRGGRGRAEGMGQGTGRHPPVAGEGERCRRFRSAGPVRPRGREARRASASAIST